MKDKFQNMDLEVRAVLVKIKFLVKSKKNIFLRVIYSSSYNIDGDSVVFYKRLSSH